MRVSGAEDIGRSVFAEDDSMLKMLAGIIELAVLICALWILSFLSTFLHEFGHALGYMLATGDRHWHIRVGWGKTAFEYKSTDREPARLF